MKKRGTFIAFAAAAVFGGVASAEEPIVVPSWPDDVPCNAVRRLDDGTWIAIKPLRYDGRIIQPNRYPGITAETMAWQQKCGAKQQKK